MIDKIIGAIKRKKRIIIIVVVIMCILLLILPAALYFITLDDAVYREGDMTNTPYAASTYTQNININSNGELETSLTAQELWDNMIAAGNRVDLYLSGPEELLKLMNAEITTQYLDTRQNPDEEIDWDKINDINSNKSQGIIKLKRATTDGNTKTMTYVDPETFADYIDKYNSTGSEADRKEALSHFTLERRTTSSSSTGTATPIVAGTEIAIPAGLGSVHTYMGWQMITATTSMQYKLREQAGMNFDEEGFGRINGRYVIACTTTYGNVGDYIDFYQEDGTIIPCIIGDIKNQNDAGCNKWGHNNGTCIVEFVVDKTTWYTPPHANPGTASCHPEWNKNIVKAVNGGSYFDNPTFGSDTITGNSATVASLDKMLFIGDSITYGLEQAHTSSYWLTNENINVLKNTIYRAKASTQPKYWLDNFSTLPSNEQVSSVCVLLGVNDPTSQNNMKKLIDKLVEKYPNKNIYIQKVFPVGKNSSGFVYTPDQMNSMIKTYNSDIKNYCKQKHNVHFIDTTRGYVTSEGYLKEDKSSDGVHLKDYNTWVQNIVSKVKGNTTTEQDEQGENENSGGTMKWPTDGTNITSPFGYRNSPTAGASSNHKGIDIGIPTGTNIYACESGTVTIAGYSDSAGNWVVIDHGNGYVSKYMHNSQLLVSAGQKVEKGQVIAKSGSTGISTGPHLHFQIEYEGDPVDPLSFKYDNGMGNGNGFGSNSDPSSQEVQYYAKVATWMETTNTIESNDPEQETYSNTNYSMTTTTINYQNLVSKYTMPFDYLWALLVVSEDEDFVLDLADLVYGSQLEITVHDNLTVNTNIRKLSYTKKERVDTKAKVRVLYGNTQADMLSTENSGNWSDETSNTYLTTYTTINKTNTLDISLTKANVWIVDYEKEYTYQKPPKAETHPDPNPKTLPEEPYPEVPDEETNGDRYGHARGLLSSTQSPYIGTYQYVSGSIIEQNEKVYRAVVDKSEDITNIVEATKYVASPSKIREKTEKKPKDPEEENFVTILCKGGNRRAKSNILSVKQWLFEILEEGDKTKDMVDLTKYLLYKVTGKSYGITEFDFSIYDPDNFQSLDGINGGRSNIEGIPGQIYDFLLAKGVPPVGAAAILGNIEGESSFNPAATNGTHDGLCQWGGGRLTGLRTYASSKGKEWTDVQTQLEYMWSELEGNYSNVKEVIMSATEFNDMEYATWYFGRYYEIFFISTNYETSRGKTAQRYEYAKKWYKEWQVNHSSGSAQLGEAAGIQGRDERIAWLYDGNGVPTSKEENDRYLERFPVEYLDRNGNRQTMNVTMHKKLKTEVQAIFKEMADAGFKVIGGDISYRTWGTDAGFSPPFPQSAHTYGHAFDVNPEQNYCIYGNGQVVGSHYSPGSDPYSVTPQIINIWKQHGFYWGGDWNSPKDYMHFSYFNH